MDTALNYYVQATSNKKNLTLNSIEFFLKLSICIAKEKKEKDSK